MTKRFTKSNPWSQSLNIKKETLQQLDLQILKAYASEPVTTLWALAEALKLPESTLRRRLSEIQMHHKVTVRSLINYQRFGLSPLMLITFQNPQRITPNIIAKYKVLSDQPKIITYFVLRSQDLNAIDPNSLPLDDSYMASRIIQEHTPLRLWEICYSERQMNFNNYNASHHKWEFPWASLREWLVSHSNLPELTDFPPPTPSPYRERPLVKIDSSSYSVLRHLSADYQTPLREIASATTPRVSTTIIHRRKKQLEEEHLFVPYLDVQDLQDLTTVLLVYRNTSGRSHLAIPLIMQSLLQLAREMPSYTFCILRHIPTGCFEYAIWIDIGQREIYELVNAIISLPRSSELEFYGWARLLPPFQQNPIAASEVLRWVPPSELCLLDDKIWAKTTFPLPNSRQPRHS